MAQALKADFVTGMHEMLGGLAPALVPEMPGALTGPAFASAHNTLPSAASAALPVPAQAQTITAPNLLDGITPDKVANLPEELLPELTAQLRAAIISNVAETGGHLAPSLGVVDLTTAMLRVFNPLVDKIIWDVGHQCYAYKILTGRLPRFHTLRQYGGISGFPKRAESPYDHFGVGHSSTSISAALGMAVARDLAGQDHHVVAVIGDGSLTGGMAYEAMNQAGALKRRLIVILNDNEMSISRNVGALSFFFSRNTSSRWMRRIKREMEDFLRSVPGFGPDMLEIARRSTKSFKTFFTPGILFEALRFKYIGPVDGHNLRDLDTGLRLAASLDEPVLLHVLTQKGKGYAPAENNPTSFHGVGSFDADSGLARKNAAPARRPSFTQAFADSICALAEDDPAIIAITAAMSEGTGLSAFAARFPARFVDVGICEPHAVTFAAGLATEKLKPVIAVYSTFLQRAYDQVVHDVCLQNLPVVFCLDRAGLVGEDGPTHHGAFDISYLRHIPNMNILAPRDSRMLAASLSTALKLNAPTALRYPRGNCPERETPSSLYSGPDLKAALPVAKGEFLRPAPAADEKNKNVPLAIVATGPVAYAALEAAEELAAEGLDIPVFDPVWLKPLDKDALCALAKLSPRLLVVEENTVSGGFGSSVLETLEEAELLSDCQVTRLGLPDAFVEQGAADTLRRALGLDKAGIIARCKELLR